MPVDGHDLDAIANELLGITEALYKATERTVALLGRLRDLEARERHPSAREAIVIEWPGA